MQSYRLQRRLKTHYSLLVPFPPLPFAYPPRLPQSGPASRARTTSPPPRLPTPSLAASNEIQLRELNQPDLLGPTSPSTTRTTSTRWDAIEEIPPTPDSGGTSNKAPTSGGGSCAVTPDEAFLVDFSKTYDPLNPQCWSPRDRVWATFILCMLVLFSGAASSMNAYTASKASLDLNVGITLINLDTTLFLVGFGVAAPIAAPLSELAGRNMVYLVSLALFAVLEVGAASSRTIIARCILRFFAGCFASPPLSNAAAGIGDLWTATERTIVFPIFAAFGLTGPCMGPLIGGWVAQSQLSYRWTDWLQAIWAAGLLAIVVFGLRETFPPTILGWKAEAVRHRSRDPRFLSALEIKRLRVPYRRDFLRTLARPFEMLVLEPIVLCFLAYLTLVFVVLFGSLVAYPFIFAPYGFYLSETPGRLGLLFLAIPVGLCVCTIILVPLAWVDYQRCMDRVAVRYGVASPEARLRVAMVGTWAIPAGLLWTAWTSGRQFSIFHPLGGQALFGFGFLTCFVSAYLYLIDSYGPAAASALSAVTFLRYLVSGGAVLFTPPMYRHLTPPFALTLLACLSFFLSFIPWLFYFSGGKIRSWSRWTLH